MHSLFRWFTWPCEQLAEWLYNYLYVNDNRFLDLMFGENRRPEVPVGSYRVVPADNLDGKKLYSVEVYHYGYQNDCRQYYWWPWSHGFYKGKWTLGSSLDFTFNSVEDAQMGYEDHLERLRKRDEWNDTKPVVFAKVD